MTHLSTIKRVINVKNIILPLFSISSLFSVSCNKIKEKKEIQIINSTDFCSDSLFTSGIEGPAIDKEGNIYAVNFKKEGTIGKLSPKGDTSLFLSLPSPSIGNSIRFTSNNQFIIADYIGHVIWTYTLKTMKLDTLVYLPNAHQPNDLCIHPNGTIFASDPKWNDNSGQLWQINTDTSITLIDSSMGTTNGLCLSPDGTSLYVNESIQRKVWKYNVLANDSSSTLTLNNKTLFYQFNDAGMDGMKCDTSGNLYIARYDKGEIALLSPEGEFLQSVQLKGKKPTNLTFGGTNGTTVYVTMQGRGAIESFQAPHPGAEWTRLYK